MARREPSPSDDEKEMKLTVPEEEISLWTCDFCGQPNRSDESHCIRCTCPSTEHIEEQRQAKQREQEKKRRIERRSSRSIERENRKRDAEERRQRFMESMRQ